MNPYNADTRTERQRQSVQSSVKTLATITEYLPHARKPLRIAAYGTVKDSDGAEVNFDQSLASAVAESFNTAHDEPTDIWGLVIEADEGLAKDHIGHTKRLEATPEGLVAFVTPRHSAADVPQGHDVECEFQFVGGAWLLNAVVIREKVAKQANP